MPDETPMDPELAQLYQDLLRRRRAKRRGTASGPSRSPLADALIQRSTSLFDVGEQARLIDLQDAIIEHLRQKWGEDKFCPYCGDHAWQVGKLVWFDAADGSEYPAVPVLCANCANTTFVNPLAAGVDMSGLVDDEES